MTRMFRTLLTLTFGLVLVVLPFSATSRSQTLGTSQAQTMPSIALTALTNQIVYGTTPNLTTVNWPASSGAVTITMPNATDTMVGRATVDTLTNKTLTAPVLGGSVTGTYTLGGTVTISAPIVSSIANTGTLTLPVNTGSMPTGYSCGNALAANGACANTSTGTNFHFIFGSAVLGSNASTITGISPAFTSTTTFWCTGQDTTTRANPVQVVAASSSSITITNTTGASDTISYSCWGY